MLPLYTTSRYLASAFSFLLISATSCSDNSEKNLAIIKALDESLINSNKMLAVSTDEVLTSLDYKRKDPGSAKRAEILYSRAQMVRSISTDTYNYLEKIKTELTESVDAKYDVRDFFSQRAEYIYDSLMAYRGRMLAIDPGVEQTFKNSLVVFTTSFDSAIRSNRQFVENFFENTDAVAALAMLNKLQNNIRLNENRVIAFCHENIATHPLHRSFSALVGQNSSVVQAGEQIEIIAGMASFSTEQKPEIFVYNKQIPLMNDGIAQFKFKAPSKTGKYYVPVKINYVDDDGRQQSIEREVTYTVAEIVKKEK